MANVSIVKVKVRRGTDAQRQQITLDQGELGFTTDYNRLFIGDGATVGGISPAIKYYQISQISLSSYPPNGAPQQIGDIVYDTTSSCFYTLTGAPNTTWSNYVLIPILTPQNIRTIVPSGSGGLVPGSLWINTKVSPNVLSVI